MKKIILNILMSVLGTMGINYICTLSSGTDFSNSILSVPIFAAVYILQNYVLKIIFSRFGEAAGKSEAGAPVRRIVYAVVLAFLFSLSFVMGWQIKVNGMTESGFAGKGKIIICSLLLGMAVFPFSYIFFEALSGYYRRDRGSLDERHCAASAEKGGECRSGGTVKLYLLCMALILLCWLPVFLAYYPAVMSYDFNVQSLQASWGPPYFKAHHPIAHTLLIWVCFEIGEALGSLQTGMAFYSIFQMLLLSAALAYAVTFIYRLCHRKAAAAAALLFFGVFPYNSILSVSVTKDVIFSALFIVFMLLIMERCFFYEERSRTLLNIFTFVVGFAMLLFRNNAIYAFVAFALIYVIFTKGRERLRTLLLFALIAVSGELALEGLVTVCGYFGKGSSAEMYSVPMQQFARVGYYHGYLNGNELDEETYALIDKYVSHEVWEGYNPPIADSVKIYVTAYQYDEQWESDMAAMWRAWAKVGMKYPNEYIDAFLCLTNGYWFLDDVTWAENLGYGSDEGKGALFTFNASVSEAQPDGIPDETRLPALKKALGEIVNDNSFYKVPVLSNLFKPALYCWTLFICAVGFLYQRRRKELLITVFPLMYLGTLLLGPVVTVRYIMPIMVFVPVLITLLVRGKSKIDT